MSGARTGTTGTTTPRRRQLIRGARHRVCAWAALLNSILDDLQRLWNLILFHSRQSQTLESARYLANTWTGPRSAQQETQQRLEQRVRLMLHKHGCMRKSALLRHLNNTSTDELNRALEALNGSELTYSEKARPQWVHARKCQCSKRAPAADSSEHKGET